ncbi:SLAM family member 5 isoform 2-T2 [Hipposideros larvatus]
MVQHYLWIMLLCLQTCLEAAGNNTNILTVNGILGDTVSFPLNIHESQKITTIAWMNSKTSVALVVAIDSETAPKVTVTHQNYQKRINVSHQNYDLKISDLRMEDAGIYKADINMKTSKMEEFTTTTRSYNLQVYRRLGKPKITQSSMTFVNRTCNVTLTCSVEKEEMNVIYSWSPLGEEGSVLQIFQTPENQELTYTCTAQNPVSNNSDSISARQLCSDITMGLHTHLAGWLSGLAVLFLFILILPSVLLFLLCKRKQDAVSKNTIYTYVTISRDTQPEESRIYDEISPSKVLPTKQTLGNSTYSVVQYSDKMEKTNTQDSKPSGTSSYEFVI